MLFAIPSLHSD